MTNPFFRIASVSPKIKVADPQYNARELLDVIKTAHSNKVRLLLTPELSLTGYTCADLFNNNALLSAAKNALNDLLTETADIDMAIILGMPIADGSHLYNCAVVINKGKIIGIVPKTYIANYNEFYEKRWFSPAPKKNSMLNNITEYGAIFGRNLFDLGGGAVLGIEICEDLWAPVPPGTSLALAGANIICNLSASDEYVSKVEYRESLVLNQSARCICAYAYAGASVFESTTDLVFSGATIIAENGSLLGKGERFKRESVLTIADVDIEKINTLRRNNITFGECSDEHALDCIKLDCTITNNENDMSYRYIDPHPFVPSNTADRADRCREILSIQSSGLAKRLEHVGSKGCIIGISGGLDSTLALLVAVRAMKLLGKPASDILGVTMPGFGTTDRTYTNALTLMRELGVTVREISIKDACLLHMRDIGHDPAIKDITYENTQARERTQVLFDLANKENSLLVGTGDLSELAMGWCTYNGDHMSMYGVNASVPKTLVKYIVSYEAENSPDKVRETLLDILDTPVSPELLPPDKDGKIAQKTEDNIGPYELHDFFLYHFVRFGTSRDKMHKMAVKAFEGVYDSSTIDKWLTVFIRRFFISQFKRSCIPDSPKVGSVSLSPRGDWRMPSDASFSAFI